MKGAVRYNPEELDHVLERGRPGLLAMFERVRAEYPMASEDMVRGLAKDRYAKGERAPKH